MRRFTLLPALAVSLGLLPGQTPSAETNASGVARANVQQAYRSWRSTDPNLESDAANNPATMAQRSDRVAAEAAKYFFARRVYLEVLGNEIAATAKLLPRTGADVNATLDTSLVSAYLGKQSGIVTKTLATIPQDGDTGFQELRRALERERAALEALQAGQKDPPKEVFDAANESALSARSSTLAADVSLDKAELTRTSAAWAGYYQSLARGASTLSPAPQSTAITVETGPVAISQPTNIRPGSLPPRTTPATPTPSATAPPTAAQTAPSQSPLARQASTQTTTQTTTPAPTAEPKNREGPSSVAVVVSERPIPSAPVPSPVKHDEAHNAPTVNAPPSRYIGGWAYPTVGEHYHGAHPESVDLDVREDAGQINGKIKIKFHVPPNGTLSPNVSFVFAGPFQAERMQSFAFDGPDGSKGTIELIPATTFNLLEINFSSPDTPGKITRGDFFLVRK